MSAGKMLHTLNFVCTQSINQSNLLILTPLSQTLRCLQEIQCS